MEWLSLTNLLRIAALKTGAAVVLMAGVWMALPVRATAGQVAALMAGRDSKRLSPLAGS